MGAIASRERERERAFVWIAKLSSSRGLFLKALLSHNRELFGLLFNVIREPFVRVASCVVKDMPTYPINNCLFHSSRRIYGLISFSSMLSFQVASV